ncbi:response regulator transcription factor [Acidaminobacter sp. JC074]|uniref:LytR/AlgR family response regulator transcription factor n=1 Tax=Acidaminobacter sp. JC074 TaxID=2530199 RepID=UPI001F0E6829|nr:LytTR family DNA-binding domain-containing protein [Acidaminobacter sp. JC074]MCH4887144.1 response regulator transcription factor [Acidaminobacter sp. JC074]
MNILILDDDKAIRDYVSSVVERTLKESNLFVVDNGLAALDVIENNHIDLMLLDVELDEAKEVLGLDFAKLISRVAKNISFIVISAHDKYAVRSFEIHPFAYIVKPIDELELIRVLQEWVLLEYDDQNEPEKRSLNFSTKKGVVIVPFEDIIYFEKHRRFVRVVTESQSFECTESIREILTRLDDRFYQTYQSFVVNMNKIVSLEVLENRSWEIKFDAVEGTALLSRYKYKEFFELFEGRRI